MRIALAQLNPTVGDLVANAAALADAYDAAVRRGADLVIGGELGLTGYPPDDLLLKPSFVAATTEQLATLARHAGEIPLLVGFPEDVRDDAGPTGIVSEDAVPQGLANAAAVLRDGRVADVYRKRRIPNYGVFDEARYFRGGTRAVTVDVAGAAAALSVCEDLWGDGGPIAEATAAGARVVLSPNASPYSQNKRAQREHWARHHATSGGAWVVYVNLVGGQDEVVFDGDSFVMAPDGQVVARAAQFREDLLIVEFDADADSAPAQHWAPRLDPSAAAYEAIVLGTRDYLRKNSFSSAVIGVSGGIDSALTLAVAVDALGPDAVTAVAMPSPYSSSGSVTDAKELVAALGCRWLQLGIEPMMHAFGDALSDAFADTEEGIAEENIQSRIRGTLLMALSNKHGHLVLATGNKSEYAVGYATLYGDMAGGFAPLKDLYKTAVFDLSRLRNGTHHDGWLGPEGTVIPPVVIDKPPSAELRPDQLDTDSLPDYDELDRILTGYIEDLRSVDSLVDAGHDRGLVRDVTRMVDRAEYKRRQAPPGVKVTRRAFGRDRRLPITHAWSG